MIKHIRRKLEEDEIVDYIIQTYAKESMIENRLLSFINEQAHNEDERKEMLASLDKFNTAYDDAIFDKLKKKLFGVNKDQYILTHLELSVCFLACTKRYYPEVIIDILWIDKERFCQVVQSFETKLISSGYKLPKRYRAMQPVIRSFCKATSV